MPTGQRDLTLPVRQGVVAWLVAWSPLTALVSAGRIYGEQPPATPVWPFIRYGFPIAGGFEAQCWSGMAARVTIHAFANGPFTDAIYAITDQITRAMLADAFAINGLSVVDLDWVATNTIRDTDNADGYHGICEYDLTAVIAD